MGESGHNGDVSGPTTPKQRGDLHRHGNGSPGHATEDATPPVDVFDLEDAVERLADGVVETRPDAAHGLGHAEPAADPPEAA